MDEGQYVPSVIYEGEVGHYPMTGGDGQVPWRWGRTREEAQAACDAQNETIGVDKDTAFLWKGYSMFGWPEDYECSFDF